MLETKSVVPQLFILTSAQMEDVEARTTFKEREHAAFHHQLFCKKNLLA